MVLRVLMFAPKRVGFAGLLELAEGNARGRVGSGHCRAVLSEGVCFFGFAVGDDIRREAHWIYCIQTHMVATR